MKALLISDFNLQNFAGYLRNAAEIEPVLAPFGQVSQTLLEPASPLWQSRPDCCIVWTRPESVLPSFQSLFDGIPIEQSTILQEVDQFVQLLRGGAERCPILFVPTWVVPTLHLGHGLADVGSPVGPSRNVMAANLRLLDGVQDITNIYPICSGKWIELAGAASFNPRLWYSAKLPFGNDVFKHAARDITAALRGIRGRARKLIVVDLDDTLWGGIVGDVGWENLILGGHDPVGEALVDFQRTLKALSRRGVALAIISKNTEEVALSAIRQHPDMQLSLDDFAAWRINWSDKAQNLAELVRELNLGLDSVVFLDDNPAERARVRESFPEVLVPDLPADKRLYTQTLVALDCFDKPSLTDEDLTRVRMYTEERKRTEVRRATESIDDWLGSLNLTVSVSVLDKANLARTTQLLNKTNQMNLSTRRMTDAELFEWSSCETRRVWGIRVADRFGDYGLTGVLGIELNEGRAMITDFILSCRVMGRRVEETMLKIAVDWARSVGAAKVKAIYNATSKNQPCLEFFRRSKFQEQSAGVFVWDAHVPYETASTIRVDYRDGEEREVSRCP